MVEGRGRDAGAGAIAFHATAVVVTEGQTALVDPVRPSGSRRHPGGPALEAALAHR